MSGLLRLCTDFFRLILFLFSVFGKNLADIMAYEKKRGPRSVPMLVEKCADFIREHGLDEEGIFRLPGQENQVKHFREAFDAGERPSFPE